ncbi:MAG: 50S ribosomal protein L29 [Planctomycetes bacterium]|nr:50S ribosomal protein L29 [Planctomycetota bacterium]
MKIADIRQLSEEELTSELDRIRRQLYDIRVQAVTEKLEEPSRIAQTKRDIARCLTVRNERARARAGQSEIELA